MLFRSVVLGDFGRFRPSFTGKSADKAEDVSANNIVRKRILFLPGKTFSNMLEDMSVTRMSVPDTDYTDGSNGGGSQPSQPGGDGGMDVNPLG